MSDRETGRIQIAYDRETGDLVLELSELYELAPDWLLDELAKKKIFEENLVEGAVDVLVEAGGTCGAGPAPTTEMNPCASCGWPESAHPVDIDGPGAGQQVVCSTFQDPTPEPEREPITDGQTRRTVAERAPESSRPKTPSGQSASEGEGRPPDTPQTPRIPRLLKKDDYRSFSEKEIQALQDEIRRLRTDPDEGSEGREPTLEDRPTCWRYRHPEDLDWQTTDYEFVADAVKREGYEVRPLYAPKETEAQP